METLAGVTRLPLDVLLDDPEKFHRYVSEGIKSKLAEKLVGSLVDDGMYAVRMGKESLKSDDGKFFVEVRIEMQFEKIVGCRDCRYYLRDPNGNSACLRIGEETDPLGYCHKGQKRRRGIMACAMMFPDTVEEFMEQYKMVDTDKVYSNGTEYVPIFRMEQWFDHVKQQQTHGKHTDTHCVCSDGLISRQTVVDATKTVMKDVLDSLPTTLVDGEEIYDVRTSELDLILGINKALQNAIKSLPSENRSGHWVMNPSEVAGEGFYICSNCNNDVYDATDFCPNCGADMRGDSDD